MRWPALGRPEATGIRALLQQMEASQWWPTDVLEAMQRSQLQVLVHHAWAHTPHYRPILDAAGYRPGMPIDMDWWRTLPILRRAQVQAHGPDLHARALPDEHRPVHVVASSGSTGTPVKVLGTAVTSLFWQAITVREHLWHRRDFSRTFAASRRFLGESALKTIPTELPHWGGAVAMLYRTGRSTLMEIGRPVEEQVAWLRGTGAASLLTFPSNAAALARHCLDAGIRIVGLEEVRTVSEAHPDDLAELCRAAWGARITDVYSTRELGYLGLQCPDHAHQHVMSECALVEVLDPQGRPCAPGERGEVIVTPLHNFASPLIRYDTGDIAEVGAPCPCGRGLPVLSRVLGRVRQMITLPDGSRHWPGLPGARLRAAIPMRQFQFVQRARDTLDVYLVMERTMTPDEARTCQAILSESFGAGFAFRMHFVDRIERSAGGKYEEFRSEL